MKILLDLVSVSLIDIAADMFATLLPAVLVAAVVVVAAVLIIKAIKKKK